MFHSGYILRVRWYKSGQYEGAKCMLLLICFTLLQTSNFSVRVSNLDFIQHGPLFFPRWDNFLSQRETKSLKRALYKLQSMSRLTWPIKKSKNYSTVKGYHNINFPIYENECEYWLLTSTKWTATFRLLFSLLGTFTKTKKASYRGQNYPIFVALVSHKALSTVRGRNDLLRGKRGTCLIYIFNSKDLKKEKKEDRFKQENIIVFIIHSKYFPNSDWLKAHA